ncbi:MAG: arsenate reductase [Zoogloeaceae bacterium]|jgi:arsenate reductase|nr:arsenate reductase [Zoogloeaceae bacterium]
MTSAAQSRLSCRVYGIKNCDTMKKAFSWLESHGIAYEFIDYKKAGVVAACLPDWLAKSDWQTLVNTRGLTWKKLDAEQRAGLDAAKAQQWMLEHPTLIKRPVLDTGSALLVGFDPEAYTRVLL